jgi:steroid delta-isomerase-like uncharacterized protein
MAARIGRLLAPVEILVQRIDRMIAALDAGDRGTCSRADSLSEDAMTKWLYAAGTFLAVTLLACAVQKNPPTTESGKAVVEAYVRAWNQHDSAAFDSILAPEAIHEDIAQNFHGKGTAEIVKFLRDNVATQPDLKWQITNSIEDGRYVAMEWTWTSTYTGPDMTGKQVKNRHLTGRGASFVEIEKGKIKRFSDYYDLGSFFR